MSEEVNVVEEINEPIIENKEILDEVSEEQENEKERVVEEKPWKKEKKLPEHIPYDRFQEVVTQKNDERLAREAAERRAAEYEARIKSFEDSKTKAKEYSNLDEILADADNLSFEEMMAKIVEQTEKKVKNEIDREKLVERQLAERKEIEQKFADKITSVKESIPDIEEAIDYLAEYADKIHPTIQSKLVMDEYGPEMAYKIASNEQYLAILVNGHPADALSLLGEIRAEIKFEKKQSETKQPVEVKPYKPMTPKVGSGNTPSHRISDNVSMSEYKRLRNQGLV